ncbi:single-stranded DNA-binding protein [Chloroflexota bacterium]
MPSLNKITIIGNIGSEPEMRFTPSGRPVTSFTVATNWVFSTPEGERKQETEWFNVVAWNRLAEQCNQFLGKGRLVYAEGRIHTRSWEGQDGQQHSRMEVIANRVIFLDRRALASLPEDRIDDGGTIDGGTAEIEPEDIPF